MSRREVAKRTSGRDEIVFFFSQFCNVTFRPAANGAELLRVCWVTQGVWEIFVPLFLHRNMAGTGADRSKWALRTHLHITHTPHQPENDSSCRQASRQAGWQRMHCLCKVQIENGAQCVCKCVRVCACVLDLIHARIFSLLLFARFCQFYLTFLWKLKTHKRFKRRMPTLGHSNGCARAHALNGTRPVRYDSTRFPLFPLLSTHSRASFACVCVRALMRPFPLTLIVFVLFGRRTWGLAQCLAADGFIESALTHTHTHSSPTHTHTDWAAGKQPDELLGLLLWLPFGLTRHWLKYHKHLIARCPVVCCKCVCV